MSKNAIAERLTRSEEAECQRIWEMVESSRKEVDAIVIEYGQKSDFEPTSDQKKSLTEDMKTYQAAVSSYESNLELYQHKKLELATKRANVRKSLGTSGASNSGSEH
jgi:hypothetical protein